MAAVLVVVATCATSVVLTARPSVAAPASQDWPTFLQNNSRTNATTDPTLSAANASTLTQKWAFVTGGAVASSASIVGTTAYVGSWDGYEYAINTTTGKQIWKSASLGITTNNNCYPPTLGITSAPSIVNGVLYVGGGGPNWYALDAATGAILWSVYTGDTTAVGAHYNWSSPLIYNGNAYIGTASNCDNPLVQGQLLEVSLTTHAIVNSYNFVPTGQVGGGVWTSPTLDTSTTPATIFCTTGTLNDYTQTQSQAIVAINSSTLAYEGSWQLPFEAAVSDSDWGTTPALATDAAGDQLVSAANKNGILYTWKRSQLEQGSPSTAPPLWQRQIAIGGAGPTAGDGSIASGIFANNTLYYAGGHNVLNGHGSGGSVGAYDPGTGAVKWIHQTEQPIIGAPAYVNGLIGYGEGSNFQVLDAATGQVLYSYPLPASTYGAVSFADGQFYVGDLNHNLYAFGLGTVTTPPADPNCPTTLDAANPAAGPVTCQDIGNPGVAGSESTSNGTLTVTASGSTASSQGSGTGVVPPDQFHFVSTPVTGDSQSSVEVTAQSFQSKEPQAGIMVRQSTASNSPFYGAYALPNDIYENPANTQSQVTFWYRTTFGGRAIELTRQYPAPLPRYIEVQRVGNLFSAALSSDGVHYTLMPGSTANIDMPATTLQGLAVDSNSTTATGTASFTNLAIGAPVTTTFTPQPPANPCPTSWTCTDIGNPSPLGNTTSTSPTNLTVDGTGTGIGTGVGGTDSFHYAYQPVSGNEALSAQVVTQAGSPAGVQEGIMMRANPSPTSPYYAVTFNPGGSATISWRYYDGFLDGASTLAMPTVTSPAYVQIVSYTDPTNGNQFFTTETSPDDVNWTAVLGSTRAIPMGTSYTAGMAATGGNRVAPAVVYNKISLAAVTNPPASICPQSFTCSDIGTNILPGNQVYVNPSEPTSPAATGVWTIRGSGSDLWSVYDNFRYEYENFPNDPANSPNGDGTVSARVVSQAPSTDAWVKTGVMIRGQGGGDPQAPYYGVFVTPGNGVTVQYRPSEGAQTNQILANPAGGNSNLPTVTPLWVLAERYTDTTTGVVYYSGFTSTNGVNWTYIPGSTVALSLTGFLTSGIATDSHNDAGYVVATVDNLAQFGGSTPPPGICPNGWSCTDVGGALPPGSDSLANGAWNEIGGGGDIWTTADAFHFVNQTLTGDGSVTAHVTAQQNTSAFAKAGPMLRQNANDPGSPYYAAFATPGQGIAVQWRATEGGATSQILVPGTVPVYLKVTRYTSGTTSYYTAYSSPDGVAWTPITGSTQVLAMTGPLLAGFGITSHAQGTGSAVTLDSVAITPGEFPPPNLTCPGGWSCADIGMVTPTGGATLTGSQWTIQGGGPDIWANADAFHYAWQSMPADGTVSAQVTSFQATDPFAKAGVMLRSTTDPASPYYAAYVSQGSGVLVQERSGQGVTAVQLANLPGAAPEYVEVVRTGTTYSAATSPDGVTWTTVPGSTLTLANLAGPLLAGMAVTSHNPLLPATAGFNSVTVTGSNQGLSAQSITFTSRAPATMTAGTGTYVATATATSGLPVTLTLDPASTGCTLSQGVVHFTGAGTCLVDANQAGGAGYAAAPQQQQSIRVTFPAGGAAAVILAPPVVGMASLPDGLGYWLVNAAGGVSPHGAAVNYGSMAGHHLNSPVAHIVSTPDGKGYWLVAGDGGTFSFGDAAFYGSTGARHLNAPVVDIASTPDGKGYWLVAGDGGIFTFGDARFHGSMGGKHLNAPVTDIIPTGDGKGYWLVATDGGIFTFGDAGFHGSMGGHHLNKPVLGISGDASGHGYRLVASDGGIFTFGDAPFHGSLGGRAISSPVVGMAGDPATGGYWVLEQNGTVTAEGAPAFGSD